MYNREFENRHGSRASSDGGYALAATPQQSDWGDRPGSRQRERTADQIQMALAIADETLLKSLLTEATPPIAQSHRIGSVACTIGVRVGPDHTADAILEYDDIACVPAICDDQCGGYRSTGRAESGPAGEQYGSGDRYREVSRLTRCESDLQTLAHHTTLAQTISVLAHGGMTSDQIQSILRLPTDGWHKSWWYTLDAQGDFTVPFRRFIRSRHYADGTLTVQYKDLFSDEKPICFKSYRQRVLVAVQPLHGSFSQTLAAINYSRDSLEAERVVLIGDRFSELEARGFINQQVSLYTTESLELPTRADCTLCINVDCPMHHQPDSPVITCRRFCLEDWRG